MAANRRAVGHGALAEKALRSTLPPPEEFPFTVRLTSEVTGSNGSSSMATVCGATLALLDAGVPISYPVAGVSVGLAASDSDEGGESNTGLLLDITGTEDHYGGKFFSIVRSIMKVMSTDKWSISLRHSDGSEDWRDAGWRDCPSA